MEERNKRKELIGLVVSDKRQKTITILVERKEKNPLYGNLMKKSKIFQDHYENNECKVVYTVKVA